MRGKRRAAQPNKSEAFGGIETPHLSPLPAGRGSQVVLLPAETVGKRAFLAVHVLLHVLVLGVSGRNRNLIEYVYEYE